MKQYYKVLTGGNVLLSDTKSFKGGEIFCSIEAMKEVVGIWGSCLDTEIKLIEVK